MLLGAQTFEENNKGWVIRSEVWGKNIFDWIESIEKGIEKTKINKILSPM